jgi:predicted permease
MQIDAAGDRRASGEARARLFDRVLDAVEQVPGVRRAGLTSQLPLSGDLDAYGIVFESIAGAGRESATSALRYAVSPGYFDAMRIPLRAGRLLDDHDRADAPMAVLVNEAFARRVFRKRSAVGERVRIGPMIDDPARRWATIVGVVGDVKQSSLALGEPDAFYVTREQWAPLFMDGTFSLVAAADGDPDGLAGAVRRAVRAAAPDEPILRVTTMTALVARSEAQRRFALVVFEAFAVAALVLATIGLYAVLAGGVTDRLREIGIRAALGASRENLVALVVGQAMALVLVGFAAGFAGAAAATRGLRSLMFGVSALDPLTYAAVVVLLVVMAIVASAVPAWRAVSVDPVRTLRAE